MIGRYLCVLVWLVQFSFASSSDQHPIGNIFQPITTPGREVFNIAMLVTLVCAAIFIVVASLLTYTIIRYRRPKNDDRQEPPQVYGSSYIEAAWTVIPILIVFVLIMVTARVVSAIQDATPPKNAVKATVVGHQWWWEIRYPDYDFVTANELNLPESEAGPNRQPTFLQLQSVDVIHSFWIPQLGGKFDVVPNRNNTLWADPVGSGTYLGNCAEYCGTQHANMFIRAVVRPKQEFEQWIAGQKKPAVDDPSVSQQKAIFESLSCVNCHVVRGTAAIGKFGPDLTHLMSRQTLASGMLPNSRENLRAWLKDPQAIKPGCLMPNMQLTTEQLDAVTAYLATLK